MRSLKLLRCAGTLRIVDRNKTRTPVPLRLPEFIEIHDDDVMVTTYGYTVRNIYGQASRGFAGLMGKLPVRLRDAGLFCDHPVMTWQRY